MDSFAKAMQEYRALLRRGDLQLAYRGLMEYMRGLRSDFKSRHPMYSFSGGIYYGTWYDLLRPILRRIEPAQAQDPDCLFPLRFRYEVRLSGQNRDSQSNRWHLIKERGWNKYQLAADARDVGYAIAHVLVEDPDCGNLDSLTRGIERGAMDFVHDVEGFCGSRSV